MMEREKNYHVSRIWFFVFVLRLHVDIFRLVLALPFLMSMSSGLKYCGYIVTYIAACSVQFVFLFLFFFVASVVAKSDSCPLIDMCVPQGIKPFMLWLAGFKSTILYIFYFYFIFFCGCACVWWFYMSAGLNASSQTAIFDGNVFIEIRKWNLIHLPYLFRGAWHTHHTMTSSKWQASI